MEVAAADDMNCPLCLDVVLEPTRLEPCGHVFCAGCISGLGPSEGQVLCPLCRQGVAAAVLDVARRELMQRTSAACEGCKATVKLDKMRDHRTSCEMFAAVEAGRIGQTKRETAVPTANRSTFACPFPGCLLTNMEHKGLIQHLDREHAGLSCAAVCPICASMPWGDANYVSGDVVGHIKLRHRFEYNEYVDYGAAEDEAAVLAAVLQQSMEQM